MAPLLVIYFVDKNKISRIMSDDPTHLLYFDQKTGELIEKVTPGNSPGGLSRVSGFSPGGTMFPARFIQKFDAAQNSLYFKPGWKMKISNPTVRLTFPDGTMSSIHESVIKMLKIVFAS